MLIWTFWLCVCTTIACCMLPVECWNEIIVKRKGFRRIVRLPCPKINANTFTIKPVKIQLGELIVSFGYLLAPMVAATTRMRPITYAPCLATTTAVNYWLWDGGIRASTRVMSVWCGSTTSMLGVKLMGHGEGASQSAPTVKHARCMDVWRWRKHQPGANGKTNTKRYMVWAFSLCEASWMLPTK